MKPLPAISLLLCILLSLPIFAMSASGPCCKASSHKIKSSNRIWPSAVLGHPFADTAISQKTIRVINKPVVDSFPPIRSKAWHEDEFFLHI